MTVSTGQARVNGDETRSQANEKNNKCTQKEAECKTEWGTFFLYCMRGI